MARYLFGFFTCLLLFAMALGSAPLYVVSALGMSVSGLLWLSERAEERDHDRA